MSITYKIEAEIFEKFPHYQRGLVFGEQLENGDSPAALIRALRDAEQQLRNQLELATLLDNPYIAAWRDAYRLAGFKPADFRPSVEALVRRVLRGDELPSINRIVDIGTLLSIKYLLPIGAHAIDHLQHGLSLRLANGRERFEPFGTEIVESPQAGEIVFCDGDTVITRRWTWRQGKHTLIEKNTSAVEFNIDALPPVSTQQIQQISRETITLLETYCHANCREELLNSVYNKVSIY
jgi:DNA/RNA-binding domain of Phe-tRNA-synthetase-like protein